MSFRWPFLIEETVTGTSTQGSKGSMAIVNHAEATEFRDLRIEMLDMISETSTALRTFENHNEPQLAQQLLTTLHKTNELLETLTEQYERVEQSREQTNYSIAYRREVIRDHDKEKGKDNVDKIQEEENRRLHEEQFQSEIDQSENLKKEFLKICRNSQQLVQDSRKGLKDMMNIYLRKQRLRRLWTLCELWFGVSFVVTMAPNIEYVLRAARRAYF